MIKEQLYCGKVLGTKQRVEARFREISATTVHISETKASRINSMLLLEQNGLRPMTYQEAIVLIDRSPELKTELKGKWFYLDGKSLKESGYYTFNNEGRLTEGKGDIEKTVYAYSGNGPLSLAVHAEEDAAAGGLRFVLDANFDSRVVALVVVGVHDPTAPTDAFNRSIDPKLVSEFRSVVAKLDSATRAGFLNPDITEVAKKVLRAIE